MQWCVRWNVLFRAGLNGTFRLSTDENILTIAGIQNIHYLFYTFLRIQLSKQKSIQNLIVTL